VRDKIASFHLEYPPREDKEHDMSSKAHVHQSHPDIVNRLKRAEGHIGRVIAMFDEGRSCLDLAQQFYAVEKAVAEAKRRLIHDHVDHCLNVAANRQGTTSAAAVSEFKAISRYL
jgi:DNA-binding FrmR family transcriptional regulator